MRTIALALAVSLTYISTAYAAEFEDSGALLDLRLLDHDQAIQELDQRLKALEAGEPPNPPDPPPDPPADPNEPVTSVEAGQDPLIQHKIPVRIQCQDFDLGGEGVAYHDLTPANHGGQYREEGVDIKATGDVSGQFQCGWIDDGEWIEFTVGNPVAGLFDIHFRVTAAIPDPGSIRVVIDGQVVGQAQVPSTGSWDAEHVTITMRDVEVRGGNMILRLEFLNNHLDLNWIEFKRAGETINRAPTGLWLCPPDPVELALGRVVADVSNDGARCDKGHSASG